VIAINCRRHLEPTTSDSISIRVTIDATKLPRDPAALRAMLLAEIARRERTEERAAAEAERAATQAERAEILAQESVASAEVVEIPALSGV